MRKSLMAGTAEVPCVKISGAGDRRRGPRN